jgi:LysM repeat protein
MEPFATQPARQSKLHWWIVSGVAAAFLIWQFDLIPRVRSAATGAVAKSKSDEQQSEMDDSFLDSDWSDIRDASSGDELSFDDTAKNSGDIDDPLAHAIAQNKQAEKQQPRRADSRSNNQRGRSANTGEDSEIEQASWEPNAEQATQRRKPAIKQATVLTADVAARLRKIEDFLAADQILEAHQEMSEIYWKHPEHRHLIQEQIDETAATIFTSPERQFAEPHFVDYGETLGSIAKKYDVPWQYLARLNRVDPEDLQAGQQLKVVQGPFGAVVDLDEFCLTVHAHGWYVHSYPIGTGAHDGTPTGEFKVEEKLENPTWYNPDGGVVDADDPENPLGEFWLGLGDHIGIHGTIDPDSIGKAASRGCIHLNDGDIDEVFALLNAGSKVIIRR